MRAESRAADFLALHRPGAGFVLPNAWDPGTARILEQVGFTAIATTSAGIAFSQGVPDGAMARGPMLEVVAAIAAAVEVPVTADLEAGYGGSPDDVAATVSTVLAAGVVGCNLEDADPTRPGTLFDLDVAAERLAAARAAAPAGSFVINARTDTYMIGVPDAWAETVRRAERYVAAGADCFFVPGMRDPAEIGRLTAEVGVPVNAVAGLTEPVLDAATLRSLGVARISVGGTLTRAALGLVERAGREMLEHGTFSFAEGAPAYGDLQERFRRS